MFFGHVNSKNVNSGDFWIFMMLLKLKKSNAIKNTHRKRVNKAHKQCTLVAKFTLSLVKITRS